MIHLYRVYFDDVADAVEVYADSPDSAGQWVRGLRKPVCGCKPVVRYVKSVSAMRANIPLVMSGKEVR